MIIAGFDQSLNACGYVFVRLDGLKVHPITAGTLSGDDGVHPAVALGWSKMVQPLVQAENLQIQVRDLLMEHEPSLVCLERPPIRRPGIERESSLLSAGAVVGAALSLDIPFTDVGAQAAKRRLTGFANAGKSQVRKAFIQKWPNLSERMIRTADQRDAWLVVWEHLSGWREQFECEGG